MRILQIIAAGAVFCTATASATVPSDNARQSPLDRAVDTAAETFFSDPCHVGLSIAVIADGRHHFYNYGTVSKAKPDLPTSQSLYEIGSVTKSFTGTLAAKAVLDGKMTLDGDFRDYLHEPYPNLEKVGKPITLRTLATHTAGMPRDIPSNDDLFQGAPDFEKLPYLLLAREKDYDRTRYLTELHEVELSSEPGAEITYSNIGLKLIGFGLENATGLDFGELMQRDILDPLGMTGTGLEVSRLNRTRLVQGYSPGGNPAPHILPNTGAAGGLISSAEDLAKFAEWHLDESDPVIALSHQPLRGSPENFALGLIWDIGLTPDGERKLWHSGGVFGMSSQLILLPESQEAYVLLANDACLNTQGELETVAMSIRSAVRGGQP
jgi:CubicO group peptidase (beta-lactamase class C family)